MTYLVKFGKYKKYDPGGKKVTEPRVLSSRVTLCRVSGDFSNFRMVTCLLLSLSLRNTRFKTIIWTTIDWFGNTERVNQNFGLDSSWESTLFAYLIHWLYITAAYYWEMLVANHMKPVVSREQCKLTASFQVATGNRTVTPTRVHTCGRRRVWSIVSSFLFRSLPTAVARSAIAGRGAVVNHLTIYVCRASRWRTAGWIKDPLRCSRFNSQTLAGGGRCIARTLFRHQLTCLLRAKFYGLDDEQIKSVQMPNVHRHLFVCSFVTQRAGCCDRRVAVSLAARCVEASARRVLYLVKSGEINDLRRFSRPPGQLLVGTW